MYEVTEEVKNNVRASIECELAGVASVDEHSLGLFVFTRNPSGEMRPLFLPAVRNRGRIRCRDDNRRESEAGLEDSVSRAFRQFLVNR